MTDRKTTETSPPLKAGDIAKLLAQSASVFEILRTNAGERNLQAVAASMPTLSTKIQEAINASKIALPARLADDLQQTTQAVTLSLPQRLAGAGTDMNARSSERPQHLIASPADLGILVKAAREKQNLSQQSFADLAGVGRRFVSELENGKATLELGKVIKVANAAGISLLAKAR